MVMKMDAESEIRVENLDSKFTSPSPSTQSELSTDGDACFSQPNVSGNDKILPITVTSNETPSEPRAKKRRKQSNPLKCQNVPSANLELPIDDVHLNKVDEHELENGKRFKEDLDQDLKMRNQSDDKLNNHDKSEFMSQKNVLSRVANTLYNNKMREIDKANRISNRGKESSLQSLTDISSPDSSDEFLQGNDYKNTVHGMYPQMPPLLPLNPADISGDPSKISSVFTSLAEFPSQITPVSMSLTQSNRSFITSNGVRIFNPEAYCELCEKEFCNKYFLKTHKANKHGICSADNFGSFSYRAPYKSNIGLPTHPQITHQMINQMCENGTGFNAADAYCTICQKSFCNKYFLKKHRQNIHGINDNGFEASTSVPSSIHVPVISSLSSSRMQNLEPKEANSADHSGSDDCKNSNLSIDNIRNALNGTSNFALLSTNGMISPPTNNNKTVLSNINSKENKNDKFLCDLCNIEFCDKYYLDTHKQNKHSAEMSPKVDQAFVDFSEIGKIENVEKLSKASEDPDEFRDKFKDQMCTPCMKNFTTADAFQSHMLEVHGASIKDEEDGTKEGETSNNKVNQDNECKDPKLDLPAYGSHAIKKQLHSQDADNSNSSNDSSTINCNLCFVKCKDRSSFNIHMESEHNNLLEKYNCLTTSVSASESVAADAAFISHDSEMQCDVCPERFTAKYMLMSHRLKTHGIISPMVETSPDSAENTMRKYDEFSYFVSDRQRSITGRNFCRICNKELCNKYFMKTHMLKMHGIDVDKLPTERSASTVSGVYCDICQKVLCSKYFLKVHKQNVHGIMEDVGKPFALSATLSDSLTTEMSDKKNTEQFSGKNYNPVRINQVSNVVFNQQNSSADMSNASKSTSCFSCDICGQTFPSKLLLQVHLVNKHVNNNDSKMTNVGGLIGLSATTPHFPNFPGSAPSQYIANPKEPGKKEISTCTCCSYINLDDSNAQGKQSQLANSLEGKMLLCHICNVSYHHSDYYHHHMNHREVIASEMKSDSENTHRMPPIFMQSGDDAMSADARNKGKPKPRKLKRFRCSKCNKTFRTRNKCLHHIHVMHKNRKGLLNPNDRNLPGDQPPITSPKKLFPSHLVSKPNSDKQAALPGGAENNHSLLVQHKMSEDKISFPNSEFHQPSPLPPVPYVLPKNSEDVIMQPFHLTEPKSEGMSKQDVFVPSLVYLPVSQKISEPVTVAFTLTPA